MKNKINLIKIAGLLLVILGIGFLASCEPITDDEYSVHGYVHRIPNAWTPDATDAVEGINVLIKGNGIEPETVLSKSDGEFKFSGIPEGSYKLIFTDIDSDDNGALETKEIYIAISKDLELGIIVLKDKD